MQIENYLYQKDLYESLTRVKPESMTVEKWKLKDRQALGLIRLTLSRNMEFNIMKEKTKSSLLKALSKILGILLLLRLAIPVDLRNCCLMKFVMLFLAKVFANEKGEIHRAVLSALTEGGEVRRKAKINMVDQNQRIKENPQTDKCDLLELWRKRALSKELYKVYVADNRALEIEGKGDVCIKTNSGNQWTLKDVRYIPGIKKNLISIGQLD
ncbi:hypothetical protein EJD97_020999 [Solanum chilense]|uniref:Retrovirus-related Pol polyprotein from transposon TNT 1-94-like beta-barrel domain-containing protein n=1 Tax=Solanum chilense TaxID=4083 RepID=A0A6N2AWH8_SOLCI|nr:hypothetical protein EJD97_020999 [Solanum chilense]